MFGALIFFCVFFSHFFGIPLFNHSCIHFVFLFSIPGFRFPRPWGPAVNPLVAFEKIIEQAMGYENLIPCFVEMFRYVAPLALDMMVYQPEAPHPHPPPTLPHPAAEVTGISHMLTTQIYTPKAHSSHSIIFGGIDTIPLNAHTGVKCHLINTGQ